MATIKALEGRTVHQIQSGQVIVDLCSVVKELVENSLDAEASSIEVRFKNNGLEAIEVQDNGVGISRENYETIALKHYTSKLSSYDDLTSLTTFGFRGEALSSLCALSSFHIITTRADEAPKGTRLDFEISGRLKGTQVVASQRGTTVVVENLFMNLPVRRRELEKNIKREYGKVVGLLQAYACISTNTKVVVSNMMAKGKKVIVFATKGNPTTRENIANVYGAKSLPGLVALNLSFEMKPTRLMQSGNDHKQVHVLGHVSRPIFGEGRQAPDRQMFFVNGRPCALPQVSKVFNEVYKSYNLSQSPFIFSDIVLDTNAYDVNVSPDKRTILLHDQQALLENLRGTLIDLFDKQDQTVPQSQKIGSMLSFKPSSLRRESSNTQNSESGFSDIALQAPRPVEKYIETYDISTNGDSKTVRDEEDLESQTRKSALGPKSVPYGDRSGLGDKRTLANRPGKVLDNTDSGARGEDDTSRVLGKDVDAIKVEDFNRRLAEQQPKHELTLEASHSIETESDDNMAERNDDPREAPNNFEGSIVKNAFDRMRPKRKTPEIATITIGSTTTTEIIGSPYSERKRQKVRDRHGPLTKSWRPATREHSVKKFGSSMRAFTAPGTRKTESALWIADIGDDDDLEHMERSGSQIQEDSESASHSKGSESAEQLSEIESDNPHLDTSEKQEESREGGGELDEEAAASEDQGTEFPALVESDEDSDGEYFDEKAKREKEDARVARLIQEAEEKMAMPGAGNMKRAHQILTGKGQKASTKQLRQVINSSVDEIEKKLHNLRNRLRATTTASTQPLADDPTSHSETSPEDRLSLTVSKEDFAHMHIIGQFNLGFILALRPSSFSSAELFIIDQHASDEKYNFERLQSSTVVQNQRLVHPRTLHLTAIEEEIILENNATLLKNGFLVAVDDSGDLPVGQRCKLLSLPMSREITFSIADLEELISILADSPLPSHSSASSSSFPTTNTNTNANNKININIPRPSAIRKMFAMRACRSSIMIGKTLSKSQMAKVVKNMGELDKPWNCPHGRPTMRHLFGLAGWQGNGWDGDGDGFGNDDDDDDDDDGVKGGVDWKGYVSMERVGDDEGEDPED